MRKSKQLPRTDLYYTVVVAVVVTYYIVVVVVGADAPTPLGEPPQIDSPILLMARRDRPGLAITSFNPNPKTVRKV